MDRRRITQIIASGTTNANINGFLEGSIYKGNVKKVCVPGLNCYSCPGAIGSCPIGSLQAVIGTIKYNFSLYVVGLIALFGVIFGRFICGWLCPFGFIQDLLYKISSRKIQVSKKVNNVLKYFKYIVLALFVIILPMFLVNEFGISPPYFCQYICPVGTLEGGIPLVLMNPSLRGALGYLFIWKTFIVLSVMIASVWVYRPFCRYICPLGAFYALFNKVSFYRYTVDKDKCTNCGACTHKCKIKIETYKDPNNAECIRCGECVKICPTKSIKKGIQL
ncbi:4Fe-4S binding protein [Geosporobacter ferrireducens]|uniref:4Fe-4S binding protein n=1 Tax=Geosporobacter ferrireducens TaxID=1424294 RepID=UPI00139D2FA6|nr:4Fe-4S binding protein [Geosporobacter ferrireducens]MTI57501.1 4Fe-4S binding protein [Geosporobacter ferrireducens]